MDISAVGKEGIIFDLFPLQPLLENTSKVNILPLVNVSLKDAGEYVCKVENSVGQSSRSAWVEVLPGS